PEIEKPQITNGRKQDRERDRVSGNALLARRHDRGASPAQCENQEHVHDTYRPQTITEAERQYPIEKVQSRRALIDQIAIRNGAVAQPLAADVVKDALVATVRVKPRR